MDRSGVLDLRVCLQLVFRGDRIAIPDEVAGHYDVVDVKVGNRSMFPVSQDMPGEAFATRISRQAVIALAQSAASGGSGVVAVDVSEPALEEFGRRFDLDTCIRAMDICLSVRPRQKSCPPFVAVILGWVVDGY